MGLVAYMNGASYNLLVGRGGTVGTRLNSSLITQEAGGLSGTVINMTNATQQKSLGWPGAYNTPNGRAISILWRIAPGYTGAPAATRTLSILSCGMGTQSGYLEVSHAVTSGNINLTGKNELSNNTFSAVSAGGSWSPTSGTYYDLVWTWTGDTTANGSKFYIDASLLGSGITASNALTASWDETFWKSIVLGTGVNLNTSSFRLDEFAIWDSIINPSSVALQSGSGSLNGASRTSLLAYTPNGGPQTGSRGRF